MMQLLSQRLSYFTLRNTLEIILYVLSLLLSIDFVSYTLDNVAQLTAGRLSEDDFEPMRDFQSETGLRLVRVKYFYYRVIVFENVVSNLVYFHPNIHDNPIQSSF